MSEEVIEHMLMLTSFDISQYALKVIAVFYYPVVQPTGMFLLKLFYVFQDTIGYLYSLIAQLFILASIVQIPLKLLDVLASYSHDTPPRGLYSC